MAKFIITISDSEDGDSITLNVNVDPPAVQDQPMTPAQQVGMHALNSINAILKGGEQNEH